MTRIRVNAKVLGEFGSIDDKLRQIFNALLNLWEADFLDITSIHRTVEHDRKLKGQKLTEYKRGVHTADAPYRALDVSVWTLGPKWGQLVTKYAEIINDMWIYDPERPNMVVCYVKPHGTGPHMHFQVHNNTRRR